MRWANVRYLYKMDVLARIEQLREELHAHNHRYYELADSVVSDREFDAMLEELVGLEVSHPERQGTDSPKQRVGGVLTDKFEKVAHRSPMLSLSNPYHDTAMTTCE